MLTRMDSQHRQVQKLTRKGAEETIAVLADPFQSWRGPDRVSGTNPSSIPPLVSKGSCVWAFLVLGLTWDPEHPQWRLHATGASQPNATLKVRSGKLLRHHCCEFVCAAF